MLNKINVRPILCDHLNDYKWRDIYFVLTPLCVASVFVYCGYDLDKDLVSILNTGYSLFLGLFFNVMVLLLDMVKNSIREAYDIEKKFMDKPQKIVDHARINTIKKLTRSIFTLILLSVLGILLGYLSLLPNKIIKVSSTFGVYFITTLFFILVLSILKMFYSLFSDDIKKLERG